MIVEILTTRLHEMVRVCNRNTVLRQVFTLVDWLVSRNSIRLKYFWKEGNLEKSEGYTEIQKNEQSSA